MIYVIFLIIPIFNFLHAGPGITIDIEPYPIGEIDIPDPGGMV